MEFSQDLAVVAASLIQQLPTIVVMIVGIVIALSRWQKHPKVSMLIVIVLTLELLMAFIYPVLQGAVLGSGARATEVAWCLEFGD